MNVVEVGLEMRGHGLPELPADHPRLDGKIHRFGKGKKAWYRLRAIMLRSGQEVVVGAFGLWRGQDPGTVPVSIDWTGIGDEERAEAERKQAQYERTESERRQRAADLASGRARRQFSQAEAIKDSSVVPYLARKQIVGDGARVDEYGQVLVPARRYANGQRAELVSVQKIKADGEKRFNDGADMAGAACLLGTIDSETRIIGIVEGYATGQSVRMATDKAFPVMVAFNAGNLLAVARQLRTDFPNAVLLFLADDDWQLEQRYDRDLKDHFGIECAPAIDGVEHAVTGADGVAGTVRASWRDDPTGTPYIELDARMGRLMRIIKFENAGISRARVAARMIGNAHVAWPSFAARGENKWTDFNDLHVQQSLADVKAQVMAVLAAPLILEPATETTPTSILLPQPPAPPVQDEPPSLIAPTLEVLLAHFALIYPTTDVWDSLRKQRLKKSAFTAWVGKDLAAKWEKMRAGGR